MKKAVYLFAGILGLIIFISLFEYTFPTASIDLRLTRTQALAQAREYITSLGYDVDGYAASVIFQGDTTKFVFLEKCLGLLPANDLVRKQIPIWSWKVRFFKELEKEGFTVNVNPIGRIDGFVHHLEERAAGDNLDKKAALAIVEDYFKQHNVGIDSYELIESSSKKRENRTDHSFEWKQKNNIYTWQQDAFQGEGMQRISVTVHGAKIGNFKSYFWTPEVFNRYIRKLFSEGRFLALISSFFYMLFYVAAIIMFIISFREAPLKFRLMVMIALIIGVPNFLNLLNSIPLLKAGYDTKVNYVVYYGSEMIYSLKSIINHIIVIIIVFCGGMFLARTLYKRQIEGLEQVLEGAPLARSTRGEIFGGYIFGCMVLGFVTLFYFVGMKYLGVWVFPSTRYSNILGTWCPFLLPLSLSLVAAISEEFTFRLFAVSFLKRFIKISFLAVFIPSLVWAFAHSSYAIFPIYTRGIELTIVALAFCFVFLRYGILACIIAHYVIDAVLFSIPLLRSSNVYFIISGVLVIFLASAPALYGYIGYKRNK